MGPAECLAKGRGERRTDRQVGEWTDRHVDRPGEDTVQLTGKELGTAAVSHAMKANARDGLYF